MEASETGTKLGISQQTLVSDTAVSLPDEYGPGRKITQYIATLAVTFGAFATGTVLSWTSPANDQLENGTAYDFKLDSSQIGWVAALVTLGAAFICFPIGILIEKIGRKPTMLALIIPFTIGWSLVVWADSVVMLYFGRFITGMAGGAFCVTAPMYTNEIAQKEIRGMLGSYFQLLLTVGILFVYVVGSYTSLRTLSIINLCVPLLFGIAFAFQPETPLYLIKKGHVEKAEKSLLYLRGSNYNIKGEIEEMIKAEEAMKQNTISIKESLKKTATKKAILISFGLMFFQQLSGINAVIFFTNPIFKEAKTSISPDSATILLGVMQVLATFAASLVIDKLGRKVLLLISDSVMALCSLALAIYFYLKKTMSEEEIEKIGLLPVISLCIFIIVFSLGYGPIPWSIIGEIFPPEIKSLIGSISCTFNWILAFLVTKFFRDLAEGIGSDITFLIFAILSAIGTVFVFFIVPETKGKSLEEIQVMLSGNSSISTQNQQSMNEGQVNKGFTNN